MGRAAVLFGMVLLLGSAEAHTSDKGITSEIVDSCLRIFCETDIAMDLGPLLEKKKNLARSKVSPEALEAAHRQMDAMWRDVAQKHKAALDALPLTPRLGSVPPAYIDEVGAQAWQAVRRRCGKRRVSRDAVLELLHRRIPELASPPPPPADAGP